MKRKFILILIGIIFVFLPNTVNADGIENFYVDAEIQKNGDLIVQEYFNMTGSYNGFERILEYRNTDAYEFDANLSSFGGSTIHNGDGLEILEVRAVPLNDNFDFKNIGGTLFKSTTSASKGDFGVYTTSNTLAGAKMLIYNPSSYNNAFYIKYILKNMAVKHNDVGEIGWNVIGNSLSESVSNLSVTLHMPGNKNLKVWAHGPLNGSVRRIDDETLFASISYLRYYTTIDVRATFDLSVIPNSTKTTNTNALDKIIKYETNMAERANYERENLEKMREEEAKRYLEEFRVKITRANYENAKSSILNLTSEELRNKLLKELQELKLILDKYELETANKYITIARDKPTYDNYMNASSSVDVIDIKETKDKLQLELIEILDLVKAYERKQNTTYTIIGIIILLITIASIYYSYKLFRKDPKVDFEHKYYREIPDEKMPLEVISYLMNKRLSNEATSASIMELIRRKIITVEKIDKKNYLLTYNCETKDNENASVKTDDRLSDIEKKIIKIIFNDRNKVETNNIKKNAKREYSSIIGHWDNYKYLVDKECRKEELYESDTDLSDNSWLVYLLLTFIGIVYYLEKFDVLPSIISTLLILFFSGFIIYLMYKFYKEENRIFRKTIATLLELFTIILSIFFIYTIRTTLHFYNSSKYIFIIDIFSSLVAISIVYNKRKRTEKGALEYQKWNAFKNFLNDFGSFYDKDAIEITMWEKYLVYATLFGCAKKIIDTIKLEVPELVENELTYRDLYYINDIVSRNVLASHNVALAEHRSREAANYMSSSGGGGFSSGSGGGGGFSSGGGSFGSGGGGGRF